MQMQKITPFLSYTDQAEEAAEFYISVIPESKIQRTIRNQTGNAVLTVEFTLAGMKFVALNAGQDWKFSPAMSLAVYCETQDEIDRLWDRLTSDGGQEVACGWLQDKYGMSWQVVPAMLSQWLDSSDADAVQRMFESLWQMKKLNIDALQKAFDGDHPPRHP